MVAHCAPPSPHQDKDHVSHTSKYLHTFTLTIIIHRIMSKSYNHFTYPPSPLDYVIYVWKCGGNYNFLWKKLGPITNFDKNRNINLQYWIWYRNRGVLTIFLFFSYKQMSISSKNLACNHILFYPLPLICNQNVIIWVTPPSPLHWFCNICIAP